MSKHISWLTQALFIISMVSGIIVVFAYYPNNAYESVQKLNYIIPFGSFFRQLHYFSSEAFLIILLIHVIIELYKKKIKISISSWNYSILALFCVILLMFTGFILKGDQSANAAVQVAFSLIKETPMVDNFLPLFKDTQVFYWKFFIWHILFFPLILVYAVFRHVKKLKVDISYFTFALALSLLLPLFIPMPEDIAPELQIEHILGPWFFWGAENMLALSLSALTVNTILAIPFLLLLILIYSENKTLYKILLLLWIIIYAYFSI
jgi:ubiquinol-cytochrome c reductase cytochrome b subunit